MVSSIWSCIHGFEQDKLHRMENIDRHCKKAFTAKFSDKWGSFTDAISLITLAIGIKEGQRAGGTMDI